MERIHDTDGETPLGYVMATDWTLLDAEMREQFRAVAGQTLSRSELNAKFGKRKATAFLSAAEPLNLITTTGQRGQPNLRYVFNAYDRDKETANSAADFLPSAN